MTPAIQTHPLFPNRQRLLRVTPLREVATKVEKKLKMRTRYSYRSPGPDYRQASYTVRLIQNGKRLSRYPKIERSFKN